ncbi:MAG TPA: hypothetical protein VGN41_03330, partial [Streptosporangiaceae bacterium]
TGHRPPLLRRLAVAKRLIAALAIFCCPWANSLKRRITVVMSRSARFAVGGGRIGRLSGHHAP